MARNANQKKEAKYGALWNEPAKVPEQTELETERPKSRGKGVFAMVIAVALLAAAAFYLFGSGRESSISLEFSKPDQVLVGQPFSVTVSFSNYSDSVLKNAKLSLSLPAGVSFLGQGGEQRIREQLVGDVGVGTLSQQSFNLIVTEGSQTLKRLEVKLIYTTGSNDRVQFESKASADIPVGSPAITLNFETPGSVFSGQNFDIAVRYENNTNEDFKNVGIRVDYPPIFRFEKSSVEPTTGNNSWELGTLTRGGEGSFTITGSVIGPEQSFFNIGGSVVGNFLGQQYRLTAQTASVGIAAAPLSLTIELNGASDYTAHIGDTLRYVLSYRNNSDVAFQNVSIQAKLIGRLLDFASARTNANLNSITNTFFWTPANTPELSTVAAGQEGSVDLEIKLLPAFPISRLSDRNFTLRLQGQIESPTVPAGTASGKTLSVSNLEAKVAGQIKIDARAFFRDASSEILNSGPYPPKVNQPTQYSIHWLIANYSTDMAGVEVSASLQSGSRWTGLVKSNADTSPVFEEGSGKVTWRIPLVPATKGVVGQPLEAIFQIENTPASNNVNQDVLLLSETRLQANDVFVGSTATASDEPLTSAIPDDPTVSGSRTVQP